MNRTERYFLYGFIFSMGVAVGILARHPKAAAILIGAAVLMVELIELVVYVVMRLGI